ncbi:MAG: TonB-dependent receptor domain-containing protein, partial [Arenimonas sp.]
NDALFQGERDYSSCALTAQGVQGTPERRAPGATTRACGGSGTNALGNYIIYQGAFGGLAHLNPDGTISGGFGTPYNYAPINYYQRPDERYTFGSSLKYEINEHFRPYMETMFMNRTSSIQVAESGTFFADLLVLDCSQTGSLCADLGLDPTAPVYAYVGRRNVEGGPRNQSFDTNSYRFVAGVEGAINDSWSYNTSFLYGHTTQDNQGTGDFLADRIGPAIRGCLPGDTFQGCIPYNPFIIGGITPEAAAAIEGTSFSSTKTELKSFNAYITGDLGWAMPWADEENISVVFGGEWREESFDFTADQDSQEGNFAGAGGPSVPLSGKISVAELFMESAVPVYKGDGILRSFALDLGYRLSDYNLSGHAETYKIGFTSDFGMVRVRGGFNHAIRAPGTAELFSGQQFALTPVEDPCAGPTPSFTAAQCALTGVSAAQYGNILESPAGQYNQFVGGNPLLQPESADTWTLGFVITPIDNLQITLDYYKIQLEEQITTIGVRDIINGCGLSNVGFLCDLIHRNPNSGDLWIGSDLVTSGYTINLTNNFGELDFRGIDLGVQYRWEMLGGRFSAGLQGTYMLNQKVNSLPGVDLDPSTDELDSAEYDCAGLINPNCQSHEWRHIASLRYSRDWFTVNLRWRYFSALDYLDAGVGVVGAPPLLVDKLLCDKDNDPEETDVEVPAQFSACIGDQTLHAQNYIDLSASAFIGKATEITVGVNNIADREPPLVGLNEAANANSPGGFDQAGRFFFANVTFKW